MDLPLSLMESLTALDFMKPTKVQVQVIPALQKEGDLIVCAETGSGKTGAFGIPLIQRLINDESKTALVLSPTRELAQQTADFIKLLTRNNPEIKMCSLVGGSDIRKQLRTLKKRPRVFVATPGRLNDHLKRKSIDLSKTDLLILDEGDRMIDMGFAPQLETILEFLPDNRQTGLFTATLSAKVKKLAQSYLNKPEHISVGSVSTPVSSIRQNAVEVAFQQKDERLLDELNQREGSVIVFLRTKHRTDRLVKYLQGYGIKAGHIHGGRSQGQRNKALKDFRSGKTRVLCATDVAARGIDVPQVAHVINFDLPTMDEDYVHRIGRTARNGADGEALSFIMPEEFNLWDALVRKYNLKGLSLGTNSLTSRYSGKSKGKKSGDRRSGSRAGSRKKFGQRSYSSRNGRGEGRRGEDNERGGGRRGGGQRGENNESWFEREFSRDSGHKKPHRRKKYSDEGDFGRDRSDREGSGEGRRPKSAKRFSKKKNSRSFSKKDDWGFKEKSKPNSRKKPSRDGARKKAGDKKKNPVFQAKFGM